MRKRGRIVLLHFVGQMPMAGIAWQAINHLVGLEKLGYEVWYLEDHGANPYDPRIGSVVTECDYNVAYLRDAMERHGFAGRWAYWDAINDFWHGMSRDAVHRLYGEADALINLCGATRLRDEHMRVPARVMIDTDPVYEQIKYAGNEPGARAYIDAHTHFFTYGANLGTDLCPVPLCGIAWRPTRPPVDLDLWPCAAGPADWDGKRCFTTIATWENKGKTSRSGRELSLVETRQFRAISRSAAPPPRYLFRDGDAAAGQGGAPRSCGAGLAPGRSAPGLGRYGTYRRFIAFSRGEFTVAKDIYVRPNSGWFSDRAVCYLASGRPVVTMRTGFTTYCRAGAGVFDYATHDEALDAIDAIDADYRRHSRAAREIAGDCFGAARVLADLMDRAGL